MGGAYRVVAVAACLLASLCAGAQVGERTRKIVLPNPQLIHCRSANCSQLWKEDSSHESTVYPSQVLTDVVNGEAVALTAVYGKPVSTQELRAAIDALYAKWKRDLNGGKMSIWRVEPDQIAISLSERDDGTKEVIYLKFAAKYCDLVPAAHIDPSAKNDCGK